MVGVVVSLMTQVAHVRRRLLRRPATHLYRIEKVYADELFRSATKGCHFRNRQTARVGSKNGVRFAQTTQLGVELFLERHVLADCFDNEVCVKPVQYG